MSQEALFFRAMNIDWNENIQCPECRKTGMVSLSQRSDELPSVLSIAQGFRADATKFGPVFYCEGCNVKVIP
jgi:hypothetical protein